MTPAPPTDAARRLAWLPWAVFLLVVLVQLPLLLNPGYFSHDELQWAAFAADDAVVRWGAVDTFQYRPLTFSLWLWLSDALFETPRLFHAVLVAGGAANAALACLLARRLGATPAAALAGAVLFGLGPQAMYVHGWIGTLGDVLWLGLGLLVGAAATARRTPLALTAFVATSGTLLALLSKEAAVAIPVLLALAAWLAAPAGSQRRRSLSIAAAAAGVVVVAYLALRMGALLDAPRSGNAYVVSVAHLPLRWAEQQLFPFDPGVFEVHTVLAGGVGKRVIVAGMLWLGVVAALSRAGWRWPVAFVLGGLAALGPALLLAAGANQYAYGSSCVSTLVAACAWPRLPRWGRIVLVVAATLVAWHGFNVMARMRWVGEVQAEFSPSLARALDGRGELLRLRVADDRWVYERLVHDIPHYAGVPVGNRVRLVGPGEDADAVVRADGLVVPLP